MTTENNTLLRYIRGQRNHVLGILEDLDEKTLRHAPLPSGWSPLALLNHLALDDEQFWFAGVVAADPEVAAAVERGEPDGWHLDPALAVDQVFARYRQQSDRTDAIIEACDLDAAPAWWPRSVFGDDFRLHTVREIVLHHLAETATHAGHLDIVREQIDGRQWIVQG
ncbi:DinB family protein [Catenulispora yoronensis]|uniref:DinB family protein n=1 Tax=Catenulispora yoronensis TaxID=450799 RepID=A0ABP5G6W3_9ACTN